MALNGRYVKLPTILEKVYRDNGYDLEISWADAAEWTAEAMDLIGVHNALTPRITIVDVDSYRAKLPCDFHSITGGQIVDYTTKIPLRGTTDTGFQLDRFELQKTEAEDKYKLTDDSIVPDLGTFQITKDGYPILPDDIDYLREKQSNKYIYFRRTPSSLQEQETYTINSNFIFTSIKDGQLMLFYTAFPVDVDGLPLIPDDTKYKRAIASYITERIDYRLWRTNRINREVYEQSSREWLFNVGSAKNKALMFTLDQAESFKNQVVRLLPKIEEHYSTFKYLGDPESLNFRNTI